MLTNEVSNERTNEQRRRIAVPPEKVITTLGGERIPRLSANTERCYVTESAVDRLIVLMLSA